jgi:hypothetical protein
MSYDAAHEWFRYAKIGAGAADEPFRLPAEWDAVTLERAADVLRARSTRPRSFLLSVLCKVLLGTAAKIRAENERK